ncbi:Golgi membrane protein 1 isoform X2 [Neoarius graeffei]|uniref:Golgi membrane protein 1 isoform X2 n=1 Tax=Neoarius graeffei TaxID=443677 RepID=UPI00298CF559|nr:Golgi membrane protein 1 isoform X2 [Neoarius graeffei]
MMGALVNVRRGSRSPPLLVVALVSCIILFGFNYWVSSSRNVELQTRLLELEEAMRRVSTEKTREQVGRSQAEEQVRRQTEQLALLEGAHQRRQQSAQNVWQQEKETLLLNISLTARNVQDMKNQMKSLREDLSKVQKQLQSCENNMNTLNKKLTYDMTQCNTQILAQKEECNERVAAAKQETQKKYGKRSSAASVDRPVIDSTQKIVMSKLVSEVLPGNDMTKSAGGPPKTEAAPGTKPKTDDHRETNELPQDKAVLTMNDSYKLEFLSTPSLPSQNSTQKSLAKNMEEVMDMNEGDLKNEDDLFDDAAAIKAKEDDAIEYDNEGEIEKRLSKLKDDKAAGQEFEEEEADYNGNDENEPEFEADKQAELAEI